MINKIILLILIPLFSYGQTQIGQDINGEVIEDLLGFSSKLSNNGAIVAIGSPGNDTNGENSGNVRVFEIINGNWVQVGNSISGEASEDFSGSGLSLSTDGNIIAIGAEFSDGNGADSGHVRVYENLNGSWTQLGNDINGEAAGDQFGTSISLSSDGNIIAIGAGLNGGNGLGSGHVRIYENLNGNWTQIGNDIDGKAATDQSGNSIGLSSDGNIVAISASRNDDNGDNSGHVRVFENLQGIWAQIGDDIVGENSGDEFGEYLSLSSNGNIIAIGAKRNDDNGDNSGLVRIYQNIGNNWTQIGIDINGDMPGDNFGDSVSLSNDGKTLAIGTRFNDDNGNNSGQVKIFDLSQILSLNDQIVENNFTLHPNPASKNITISLIENQEVSLVNIYNNLGQLVQTDTKTNIDISTLATGSYYVQVTTDAGVSTQKLLVE